MSEELSYSQNNPYGIDDDCFTVFRRTEAAIGTADFSGSFSDLVALSLSSEDNKSLVLAYVLNLRHAIAQRVDSSVDSALDELKVNAEQTGYTQYFYHGYILASTYYSNTGMSSKSLALAQEMEAISKQNNDAYGRWSSDKFLATQSLSRHNYKAAKEYLLEAIEIYNSTDDRNVRSQSLSSVYTDIASTYPFDNDSLTLNLQKAMDVSASHIDTLRYYVSMARVSAARNDIQEYRGFKELAQASGDLRNHIPFADYLFRSLDKAVDGDFEEAISLGGRLDYDDLVLLQTMARNQMNYQVADILGQRINEAALAMNSSEYSERLAEIGARIGNDKLNRDLLTKSQQLNRLFLVLFVALFVFFIAMSLFWWMYTRNLSREKKKAENANMMKTKFVQNMRHEIRTPLNAIVGFSQLLALPADSISDEERDSYVRHITGNSDLLTTMIDDIISLSDFEKGDIELNIGECSCNELCHNAVSSVRGLIPNDVICRVSSSSESDVVFRSDEKKIQQILVNFLTNAFKHTSEGEVVVDWSVDAVPGKIVFSVTDSGEGVPAEKAEAIFTMFEKIDTFKQGSGLGLNICRNIAQKLGAEVCLDKNYGRCASNSSKGARFLFIVPR